MRNPASDPFALDGGPTPEELQAAAPAAMAARDSALTIIPAFLQRDVEFSRVAVSSVSSIDVEASLAGDYFLFDLSLQTDAGELLQCLVLAPRDETAEFFGFERPAEADDWSAALTTLRGAAESLVDHINTGLGTGMSFTTPDVRIVGMPEAFSTLLVPDAVARVDLDLAAQGSTLPLTIIAGADLVRAIGGGSASGEPLLPDLSDLLDEPPNIFASETSRTGSPRAPADPAARGGRAPMIDLPQGAMSGDVRPAQFPQFAEAGSQQSPSNLDLILDVNLKVSVQLGRTQMSIREVLDLGPGFVIELDKLAGEPVDILVNDKPIARGEVVVVDENFGVRVVDIISPQKRIASLR